MTTAIVVPCFNEEASIEKVLSELNNYIDFEYQTIVIDDASEDLTSEKVLKFNNIILLTLPVNLGVGTAFQTGLFKALNLGCEYVVKLDGDGQHPPEFLGKLLEPLKNNEVDIVIGSRFLDKNLSYKVGFFKQLGMMLLKFIVRILTGFKISDPTSGFRAYNLKAMVFMAKFCPNFDYYEPEEIILASKNGLKIKEIPVTMREREAGVSSITALGSIFYMLRVILSMIIIYLRKPEKWE